MVTGRLSASVLHHESMDGDLCANKTVNYYFNGVWLSLVEHSLWERRVAGSNPATPTNSRRTE